MRPRARRGAVTRQLVEARRIATSSAPPAALMKARDNSGSRLSPGRGAGGGSTTPQRRASAALLSAKAAANPRASCRDSPSGPIAAEAAAYAPA